MYSGVARSSYRQHCWSGRGHLSHEVRTGTPQRERSGIGRTPQSANQLTDWRRRRRKRKEITYERIGIHLFQKVSLFLVPSCELIHCWRQPAAGSVCKFPAFVEVRTAPICIAGKSLCSSTSMRMRIYQYFQTSSAQYYTFLNIINRTREYCDWLTYGPLPHPPCYVNKSNFSLIIVGCPKLNFFHIFRLKNGKCIQ